MQVEYDVESSAIPDFYEYKICWKHRGKRDFQNESKERFICIMDTPQQFTVTNIFLNNN
jgi:hypothetical protein